MANASLVTMLLILLTLSVVSLGKAEDEDEDARKPHIVHMMKSMKPPHFTSHRHWYASMLYQVSQSNPTATELLYTYDTLLHGFAAMLSRPEAKAMETMEGCLAVMPSSLHKISTTHTPEFLGLASSPFSITPGLWSQYSAYGRDIIVGVIDTGLWPESKSFNDQGLGPVPSRWKGACASGWMFNSSHCNSKVIGARYYFKGYEQTTNIKLNETSPRDTNFHGTHTASTAAGAAVTGSHFYGFATGTARGMAPQARLAIYKACWGSQCDDADTTAAMEQAVADGVDIISYSISSTDGPFYNSPAAIGAYGAIEKGVLFTASAGNRGPFGSTLSNPAPWVITVGASSIDRDFPASVLLGNGKIYRGTSTYRKKSILSLPLVYVSTNNNSRRCLDGSLNPNMVKGKIVLCDQLLVSKNKGETTAFAKGQVVAKAGGAGMIVANEELYGEDQRITHPYNLPAISVSFIYGEEIKKYINSNPNAATATMNITADTMLGKAVTAPVVAAFSSRGPSKGFPRVLKPDMIAPGVNILAAVKDSYNFKSGTSMACPHVSGIAALMKQIHPTWSPAAIKSALMTSSYVMDNTRQPIKDSYTLDEANPFIMGAGHVEPRAAVDPGLLYDMGPQDYINFLCSLGYTNRQIALLTHNLNSCPTSPSQPDDLNYPSFSVLFDRKSGYKPVQARRTVTYVGKTAPAAYQVSVKSPLGVTITVQPQSLNFQNLQDKASYTVTFQSGTSPPSQGYAFGEITWKGVKGGAQVVRSPVVFTW